MNPQSERTFWFVAGSQHLYGPETLAQVSEDIRAMADAWNASDLVPCPVTVRPVMTTPDEIEQMVRDAEYDTGCAGLIVFMHTFSPGKIWINGLSRLTKPYCHLHTQFRVDIPDREIDMDYMNLHQSAHGDREHGYVGARLRMARSIVVGHWADPDTQRRLGDWMRAAVGVAESRSLKVMRFGDNMRQVAVTEGDKVGTQLQLGWQVNTWAVGELVDRIQAVPEDRVTALLDEYRSLYTIATDNTESIRYQARLEAAMTDMLDVEGCTAFTNTFEDLVGMHQLPGLATQRLMARGYGYGGEGDWKVSAMTRVIKAMGFGRTGGTSFMEDYTYDLTPGRERVLGAHMLEVCPSIAADRPRIEVHPLGIGDREDPARLIFTGRTGPVVLASLVDMGGRLRLIVQEAESVASDLTMPNLPVARILWQPEPDLPRAAEAWIRAGGAHHTVLSFDVTAAHLRDWARMMDIEFVRIGSDLDLERLEKELFWSDLAWKLR